MSGNPLDIGASRQWAAVLVNAIGKTGRAVHVMCALVLENTVPGTRAERGLAAWASGEE